MDDGAMKQILVRLVNNKRLVSHRWIQTIKELENRVKGNAEKVRIRIW
jgi:hypothetical protein